MPDPNLCGDFTVSYLEGAGVVVAAIAAEDAVSLWDDHAGPQGQCSGFCLPVLMCISLHHTQGATPTDLLHGRQINASLDKVDDRGVLQRVAQNLVPDSILQPAPCGETACGC